MPDIPTLRDAPLRDAIIAQVFGALIAFALIYLCYRPLFEMPLPAALVQGVCAAFVAWKLECPRWWLTMHLCFLPLVVLALALQIAPGWYLAAFALTLLVFWRTDKSRVPLYLSNTATAAAVAQLLPPQPCRVLDLGCGDGRLLRALARARPDCAFTGIEHAPATWLWARIGAGGMDNLQIRHGDFWRENLGPYDVVYAFLSPAPMPELWRKAGSEMRPGGLLLSNSFAVPAVAPAHVVAVGDGRDTQLYCYTPASQAPNPPESL